MGNRTRCESERMRTVWTLEMDRYFIDLMLEQMGKWNDVCDHTFNKYAWNQMTSLFNDKFKFQYDMDILKNRHKTLRTLYRDVLHLLGQDGFIWNDTLGMVTADSKVWDEHIKVHPKSRPYRIKTIPYFHDLCEIYKHVGFEKKVTVACDDNEFSKNNKETQSDSGSLPEGENSEDMKLGLVKEEEESMISTYETPHEIALIEYCGLSDVKIEMPVDDSTSSTLATNRTRTCWQPQMDFYFIHLMLDQVKKGNQVGGLFRREAWVEMVSSFNAKFGFHYEFDILKNRFKSMRKQYNVINDLLKLDGFVWDDVCKMVTADEQVWQEYIKVNATAAQYMTKHAPYYKELCVICGEHTSDGKDSLLGHNTAQVDEALEAKFGVLLNSFESPLAFVSIDDQTGKKDDFSNMNFNGTDPSKSKRQLDNPSVSERSKKARSEEEGIAHALHEMANTTSSLAGKINDEEKGCSNSVSIEKVIKAIQALPEMDDDLILDACDFLEDEKRAKIFLALDVKLRKKWLVRKLRPSQE
ncbi:unnamed protein product [Cuscuta epithymum]|uniref:Myb/SANT-like domain-containing protein n=1 Tax=Cuscuta epithymum TaxID=186058 RepID=A0AAV0FAN6_9ASTE|nr:unnamed protein product [Cuscuta epithymum]